MPKKAGSNWSMPSMTDPAFTKPGSDVSAPPALSSSSLKARMDSTPSRRFAQKASTSAAPGNRPAMPTIAISSRSSGSGDIALPPRQPELALTGEGRGAPAATTIRVVAAHLVAEPRGQLDGRRPERRAATRARGDPGGGRIDAPARQEVGVAHGRGLGVDPVDHLRLDALVGLQHGRIERQPDGPAHGLHLGCRIGHQVLEPEADP